MTAGDVLLPDGGFGSSIFKALLDRKAVAKDLQSVFIQALFKQDGADAILADTEVAASMLVFRVLL